MSNEVATVERDGPIVTVTINRPQALNALNHEIFRVLTGIFTDLAADKEARVVILTGSGDRSFVAGADIAEMKDLSVDEARDFLLTGQAMCTAIENAPQVVIAAINGYALGGGCELALACDIRLANDKARIGLPETGLGIIPGLGGTQRLPRLVGAGVAKQLIFSADAIDAPTALRIGLVNEVTTPEELIPAARKLAERICRNGPIAIAQAKRAIDQGIQVTLTEGLRIELDAELACFASGDRTEGLTAFVEKRPPSYTGS